VTGGLLLEKNKNKFNKIEKNNKSEWGLPSGDWRTFIRQK